MKPPATTDPLSSAELEQDAADAGVAADEAVEGRGGTHLPASESGEAAAQEPARPHIERGLTRLPPG